MNVQRACTYSYLTGIWRKLATRRTCDSAVGACYPAGLCTIASTSRIEDHEAPGATLHHEPVLAKQVLEKLHPKPGQTILDMTFGGGGHTKALLQETPDIKLFCLDRDPVAYERARQLAKTHEQITPLHGKFSEVHQLLHRHGYSADSIDGVLLDLGGSSLQYDDPSTGFSISRDGPLDMRMDRGSVDTVTAEDVVNGLDETGLFKILKKYGEEKRSREIARTIVESRYAFGRIKTTSELAKVISSVFEGAVMRDKLYRHAHAATRSFQALRIFVNNELNELHNGLSIVHKLLRCGGCCVAISFHSLEDRIVKRHFHGIDMDAKIISTIGDHVRLSRTNRHLLETEEVKELLKKFWEPVARKVVMASDGEILENPRARSAKMRAAYKLE